MKKLLAMVVFSMMLVSLAQAAGAPAAVTTTSNTATAATTLNTNLVLNATINTALALDIQSATGGCSITNSGSSPNKQYSMTFGPVDGLGLSTPSCASVTATKSSSAGGGYLYTTPYKYIARFSGFNPTSAGAPKLQAYYTQTFNGVASTSTSAVQMVEGSTAAGVAAMGLGSAAIANVATGLTSDETNTGTTRFIGLQVFEYNGTNANPNSATGATYAATVTFVLTPQ